MTPPAKRPHARIETPRHDTDRPPLWRFAGARHCLASRQIIRTMKRPLAAAPTVIGAASLAFSATNFVPVSSTAAGATSNLPAPDDPDHNTSSMDGDGGMLTFGIAPTAGLHLLRRLMPLDDDGDVGGDELLSNADFDAATHDVFDHNTRHTDNTKKEEHLLKLAAYFGLPKSGDGSGVDNKKGGRGVIGGPYGLLDEIVVPSEAESTRKDATADNKSNTEREGEVEYYEDEVIDLLHSNTYSDRNLNQPGDEEASGGDSDDNSNDPLLSDLRDILDPEEIDQHNDLVRQFNQHRHLSRFELEYRMENGLDLDLKDEESKYQENESWNGNGNGLRRNLFVTTPYNGIHPYQTTPLSQGYGTHYATVYVGTPPQRKSVIVDTGSHYTAFPCMGCANCGEEHHTDKYFDPDQSSTFRVVGCGDCSGGSHCQQKQVEINGVGQEQASSSRCIFTQSYTEGSSWMAYQAVDEFFAGPAVLPEPPLNVAPDADPESRYINHHDFSIPFMFGCQISETGLFVTQLADGIMGMSAHEATLPKKLHDAGKIKRNLFTLCFRNSLTVEKEGINAGLMTIGGVDGRLHSTPMVYARNVARSGWYTIYVTNVYLRTNGGQGAASDDPSRQHIMKIPVSAEEMNSGKGVIVDSGTTDTYLHKSIAGVFGEAWRAVTGRSYSNSAVRLTRAELLRLPTVLLQIRSFDGPAPDYDLEEGDLVGGLSPPGLVGPTLSPHSPSDVLLAIPATHYMEYSATKDVYTSRLYFTESRGGVLGANSMQGHNVLFDWENGRVGFAESTCAYADDNDRDEADERNSKENMVKRAKLKQRRDCELGPPVLTITCAESVSRDDPNLLNACGADQAKLLPGRETWSRMVEVDGLGGGLDCMEVMAKVARGGSDPTINPYLAPGGAGRKLKASPGVGVGPGAGAGAGFVDDKDDGTTVECDPLSGLCHAITPCSTTCGEAQNAAQILSDSFKQNAPVPLPGHASLQCGDNLWGSCSSECKQGRLPSFLDDTGATTVSSNSPLSPNPGVPQVNNGVCVSHPSYVEIRDCHIDSCGRVDACRVPFVVHAILAFRGGDLATWHRHYEQGFAAALAETINRGRNVKDHLFDVGDVEMLMVGPWYNKDDGEEAAWLEEVTNQANPQQKVVRPDQPRTDSLGIKVVLEISIFNDKANTPIDESPHGQRQKLKGLADKLKSVTRSTSLSTCSETDFYPLSQRALDIHMELGRSNFMVKLVEDLKAQEHNDGSDVHSPFLPLFQAPQLIEQSQLVTSWTIKTEPNGRGGVHDHYRDASYRSKGPLMYYLTSPRFWFGIVMLAMSLLTFCRNMSDDDDDYDDGTTIVSSIQTAPARSGGRGGRGGSVSIAARARNTRGTVGNWARRRYAKVPSYDNATVA